MELNFFSILCCCDTTHHLQGDLVTFGYRPAMRVEIIKSFDILGTCFNNCVETWQIFIIQNVFLGKITFGNFALAGEDWPVPTLHVEFE